MKEDVLFRKTPFGGFDRVEVIDYIQQLKQTQQNHKCILTDKEAVNNKLTADNDKLLEKTNRLERALEINKRYEAEIEAENKNLRAKYDILLKKMEKPDGDDKKLIEETIKKCNELVETASKAAKQIEMTTADKLKKTVLQINENNNISSQQVTKLLEQLIMELS